MSAQGATLASIYITTLLSDEEILISLNQLQTNLTTDELKEDSVVASRFFQYLSHDAFLQHTNGDVQFEALCSIIRYIDTFGESADLLPVNWRSIFMAINKQLSYFEEFQSVHDIPNAPKRFFLFDNINEKNIWSKMSCCADSLSILIESVKTNLSLIATSKNVSLITIGRSALINILILATSIIYEDNTAARTRVARASTAAGGLKGSKGSGKGEADALSTFHNKGMMKRFMRMPGDGNAEAAIHKICNMLFNCLAYHGNVSPIPILTESLSYIFNNCYLQLAPLIAVYISDVLTDCIKSNVVTSDITLLRKTNDNKGLGNILGIKRRHHSKIENNNFEQLELLSLVLCRMSDICPPISSQAIQNYCSFIPRSNLAAFFDDLVLDDEEEEEMIDRVLLIRVFSVRILSHIFSSEKAEEWARLFESLLHEYLLVFDFESYSSESKELRNSNSKSEKIYQRMNSQSTGLTRAFFLQYAKNIKEDKAKLLALNSVSFFSDDEFETKVLDEKNRFNNEQMRESERVPNKRKNGLQIEDSRKGQLTFLSFTREIISHSLCNIILRLYHHSSLLIFIMNMIVRSMFVPESINCLCNIFNDLSQIGDVEAASLFANINTNDLVTKCLDLMVDLHNHINMPPVQKSHSNTIFPIADFPTSYAEVYLSVLLKLGCKIYRSTVIPIWLTLQPTSRYIRFPQVLLKIMLSLNSYNMRKDRNANIKVICDKALTGSCFPMNDATCRSRSLLSLFSFVRSSEPDDKALMKQWVTNVVRERNLIASYFDALDRESKFKFSLPAYMNCALNKLIFKSRLSSLTEPKKNQKRPSSPAKSDTRTSTHDTVIDREGTIGGTSSAFASEEYFDMILSTFEDLVPSEHLRIIFGENQPKLQSIFEVTYKHLVPPAFNQFVSEWQNISNDLQLQCNAAVRDSFDLIVRRISGYVLVYPETVADYLLILNCTLNEGTMFVKDLHKILNDKDERYVKKKVYKEAQKTKHLSYRESKANQSDSSEEEHNSTSGKQESVVYSLTKAGENEKKIIINKNAGRKIVRLNSNMASLFLKDLFFITPSLYINNFHLVSLLMLQSYQIHVNSKNTLVSCSGIIEDVAVIEELKLFAKLAVSRFSDASSLFYNIVNYLQFHQIELPMRHVFNLNSKDYLFPELDFTVEPRFTFFDLISRFLDFAVSNMKLASIYKISLSLKNYMQFLLTRSSAKEEKTQIQQILERLNVVKEVQ